ncbi:MAG: glucose-6-phosphate isomerase, partial [Cyclobacteriaceae bacterium]
MLSSIDPTETNAWSKLTSHFISMQATHLRELFEEDPERFKEFHLTFNDMLVDFSKNHITQDTLALL